MREDEAVRGARAARIGNLYLEAIKLIERIRGETGMGLKVMSGYTKALNAMTIYLDAAIRDEDPALAGPDRESPGGDA